ncbi:MAG TPA: hypothetical protein VF144_12155 [Chitinophagaceae bacterium]
MKNIGLLLLLFCFVIITGNTACRKETVLPGSSGNTGGAGGSGGNNANRSPRAKAGNDTIILLPSNQAILNGSGSYDPDNNIKSYEWVKISGPASYTIVSPATATTIVRDLDTGIYQFELTVKDEPGLLSKDTMQMIVSKVPTNGTLVANAGTDQLVIIQLPNVSAFLNGSASFDLSGAPLQFLWRQISGPSTWEPVQPWNAITMIYSPDVPGVYSFELKVWNNNGIDYDTINVSVSMPYYCGANRPELQVPLTFLSDLPGQIQDPEIIAAGNKLFIPNWFSNATATFSNNVYVFDRITQNWTTIQTSQVRVGVAAIAAGNKVFFAGGMDPWTNAPSPIVDIYDITTNTWSTTNLSEARSGCKAVVSGNHIFFAGGLKSDSALSNKVDIYDLETNNWSSSLLPGGARIVGAAVAVQNKVLFCGGHTGYGYIGGWNPEPTTPTPTIETFDIISGQWSSGSMQVNKEYFAVTSVNEKVFFAGGFLISGMSGMSFHVEELNVNTMNSTSSCLHQPMVSYGSKGAVIKNDLIIFFNDSPLYAGVALNRFDIFNWQTGNWSVGVMAPDLADPGSSGSRPIVSVDNQIYTIIGNKLFKMNL